MLLLMLPFLVMLVAHLAALVAWLGLRRAYDCDLYLPGGTAFDPRGQNRQLLAASAFHLIAAGWLVCWLIQKEKFFRPFLNRHEDLTAGLNLLASLSLPGAALFYLAAMVILLRIGRHLGRFSDLKMTRLDGSVLLPRNLMQPLWLALNAHGTLLLIVPAVLAYRSLSYI